jgi:hypothetical protein
MIYMLFTCPTCYDDALREGASHGGYVPPPSSFPHTQFVREFPEPTEPVDAPEDFLPLSVTCSQGHVVSARNNWVGDVPDPKKEDNDA